MMEPTFAESTNATVTTELRALIDAAFERLQNWAFNLGIRHSQRFCKIEKGQIVRAYFRLCTPTSPVRSEPGNSQAHPQFIPSDSKNDDEKEQKPQNKAIDNKNSLPTSSRPTRTYKPSTQQES
jgi:hypothetical protein